MHRFPSCKVRYACAVAVGMLSIASTNCEPEPPPMFTTDRAVTVLVLLRLWVLWDRSPRLMIGTLTIFVATQLAAMSLAGYVIYKMLRACVVICTDPGVTLPLATLFFSPLLHVCMPDVKPKFVLLWSPGVR